MIGLAATGHHRSPLTSLFPRLPRRSEKLVPSLDRAIMAGDSWRTVELLRHDAMDTGELSPVTPSFD
jgi:hypothetical protein